MREFDLLKHIYATNTALPDSVVIPPGDDMGGVRVGNVTLLVTVDQVADGVHVDLTNTPLELVGRKAITRSLSDVAAMAAKPIAAVVAGSLPRDFESEQADFLCNAMRKTCESYDCPLIGGDISLWDSPMVLTVTVFGEPAGIEPVLRSGAKVGDGIYVSGELGGSFASGHHLTFEPRIDLARRLAGDATTRPNCMIDLSDGLARDMGHLCDAAGGTGGIAAVIEADLLPMRTEANGDWRKAVGEGEDYELLMTCDRSLPADKVTRIGSIVPREGNGPAVMIRLADGAGATMQSLNDLGWEHHT